MSNHYPERLGLVICLNHNKIFQGIWKAIKSFLHPNTVAKMQLVRSKEKIAETFNKYFSEELSEWLLTEIKLNKSKPMLKTQKEFWKPPESGHDPRGCPSYIASLAMIDGTPNGNNPTSSKHLPHPNILDALAGNIKEIVEDDQVYSVASSAENSDEENNSADVPELEIPDEFNIPKEATHLQG